MCRVCITIWTMRNSLQLTYFLTIQRGCSKRSSLFFCSYGCPPRQRTRGTLGTRTTCSTRPTSRRSPTCFRVQQKSGEKPLFCFLKIIKKQACKPGSVRYTLWYNWSIISLGRSSPTASSNLPAVIHHTLRHESGDGSPPFTGTR